MEDNDEILAVELMDLTQDVGGDEGDNLIEPHWPRLTKNWTEDPKECVKFYITKGSSSYS